MGEDFRNLADEELMELIQGGDPRAFELVYDRHGGAAFSLAYRIVGHRNAAEDVVQEAFLAIWRSRLRYQQERGSVRTWVLGIVHHRAIDALRRDVLRRKRAANVEEIEDHEAPERTDVEAARLEEARRVKGALGTLPEEQSKVIQLAYYGGFSQSEIAELLETPLGTIKGRMRLGLEKLRDELGEAVVA